jgi:hypothetical protein
VVETGGLENRCTGNRTGGSNPSPSASYPCILNDLREMGCFSPSVPFLWKSAQLQ